MKIRLNKLSLVLIILFQSGLAWAYDFNISGYVFELPVYQHLGESIDSLLPGYSENKNLFQCITKIRLRPVLSLWEDARLEAAFETTVEISRYANPLFESGNIFQRHAVDMDWNIYSEGDVSINESIDRLFFKQTFEDFELTLGRQRINWGVGRVWQPTELFHPLNPANFGKIEKTGADALSAKFFFGNFTDAELVVNFRERLSEFNYGLRLRTNFSPFDMSGIVGYFDKNPILGFDFTGNIIDAGIRAEAVYIYHDEQTDSSYARFILGLDRQLTPYVYALIEFLYNGQGETCKYCYNPYDLLSGRIINLGVYYVTGMASWQIHPLVVFNGQIMYNINDTSGYIAPSLNWSAMENLSISAGSILPWGLSKSEFWYYPISAYLNIQYFF